MRTGAARAKPAKRRIIRIVLLISAAAIVLFALVWTQTGKLSYTTTFTVLDENGQPVCDTEVRYSSRTLFQRLFVPEDELGIYARTDSEGRFTLKGCKRGIWIFNLSYGSEYYTIQRYLMGFSLKKGEVALQLSASDLKHPI